MLQIVTVVRGLHISKVFLIFFLNEHSALELFPGKYSKSKYHHNIFPKLLAFEEGRPKYLFGAANNLGDSDHKKETNFFLKMTSPWPLFRTENTILPRGKKYTNAVPLWQKYIEKLACQRTRINTKF